MTTYEEFINESNLNSISRKINKDTPICIITPYRNDKAQEDNEADYNEMKSLLKSKGYGYLQLNGGWTENKGKDNEALVHEKSLFIEVKEEQDKELFELGIFLTKKYKQDGFIFKSQTKEFGIYLGTGKLSLKFKGKQEHTTKPNASGFEPKTSYVQKISFKDIQDLYSSLRFGKHKNIQFVFEDISEMEAHNIIGAYIRKEWNNN